jgi:hypothetical protein
MTVVIPEIAEAAEAAADTGAAAQSASGAKAASKGASSSKASVPGQPTTKSPIKSPSSRKGNGQSGKRATGSRKKGRGRSIKVDGFSKSLNKPIKGSFVAPVAAEFLLAVVLIWFSAMSGAASDSYEVVMSKTLVRLTTMCGIFFILALLTTSQKAGKFAVAVGALIDVGILFNVVKSGVLKSELKPAKGEVIPTDQMTMPTTSAPPHNIVGGGAVPDDSKNKGGDKGSPA